MHSSDDRKSYRPNRTGPKQDDKPAGKAARLPLIRGGFVLRPADGIPNITQHARFYLQHLSDVPPSNDKVEVFIAGLRQSPDDLAALASSIGERTLFQWLDQVNERASVERSDFAIAVASLMCLRWIETGEAESRAILQFEGGELSPGSPPPEILERWMSSHSSNMPLDLGDELLRMVKSGMAGEAASYAEHILPGLRVFAEITPHIQTALVWRILMFDPSNPRGRQIGRMVIDLLLSWLAKEEKGHAGEFFTPRLLADLMVDIVDPAPGERVYDPCFGTANLLAAAARRKLKKTKTTDTAGWNQIRRNGIYGREINSRTFILGLARLVYEGIDPPRLEIGNSLETEGFNGQAGSGYDCILANPPFGLRVDEPLGHHFPVQMREADGLFIQHIIQSLRPGGRAVVLVPPGTLFTGGQMAKLREHLIEHNHIEMVIALPKGVLKPYTSVAANILVLRNDRSEEPIEFLNLSRIDLDLHRGKTHRELAALPEAYSYFSSTEEIAARDFDLTVRERGQDLLNEAVADLGAKYPEIEVVPLREIADVRRGAQYTRDQLVEKAAEAGFQAIPVIRVSDVQRGQLKTPKVYLKQREQDAIRKPCFLKPEDTLLTISGTIGKVAYASEVETPSLVTHGLAIIRSTRETVSKRYLFALLSSDAYQRTLSGLTRGSSIGHLSLDDLRSIPIPVPPIHIQLKVVDHVESSKGDGFAFLLRILDKREEDPIEQWLESSPYVGDVIDHAEQGLEKSSLLLIEMLVKSLRDLRNRVVHLTRRSTEVQAHGLLEWMLTTSEAIGRLASIGSVGDLAERFYLLHTSLLALNSLQGTHGALFDATSHHRASMLSRSLELLLKWQKEEISEKQSIETSCSDRAVPDEPTSITVTIRNEGPLPLRELQIPDPVTDEIHEIPYLPAKNSASVEVNFLPDNGMREFEGRFYFNLQVRALHLDDGPFEATLETSVEVQGRSEKEVEESTRADVEAVLRKSEADRARDALLDQNLKTIFPDDGIDFDAAQDFAEEAENLVTEAKQLASELAETPEALETLRLAAKAAMIARDAAGAVAEAVRAQNAVVAADIFVGESSVGSQSADPASGVSLEELSKTSTEATHVAKALVCAAIEARAAAVNAVEETRGGFFAKKQRMLTRLHSMEALLQDLLARSECLFEEANALKARCKQSAAVAEMCVRDYGHVLQVLEAREQTQEALAITRQATESISDSLKDTRIQKLKHFQEQSAVRDEAILHRNLESLHKAAAICRDQLMKAEDLLMTARKASSRADNVLDAARIAMAKADEIKESAKLEGQRSTVEVTLGTSPYNTGSPVERADMLFGRDRTLEEIRTQLPSTGRANVILLEGNRRAGKTSILKRIQQPDFLPDWVAAYCSLQSGEGAKSGSGLATAEVFRIIARSIGEQLIKEGIDIWFPGHPAPDPNRSLRPQFRIASQQVFSGDYPFETFENFLIACLEAVKPRRLLLCLDEFDKLQEGIDNKVTSSTVPENIRYLIHEHPDFAAILTGSRRLKRLREEYWSALFGLGDRIGVSALDPEDARALVTKPVEGRLSYSPDSVDEIIRLTARQPFLIQSLCNRIFKDAKDAGITSISPSHVKHAVQRMVEDNEHFRTLWGYAETWRRRLILALARRQEAEGAPLTLGILREQMPELGVILPDGDPLGDDLAFLRELEMIRFASEDSSQSYALEVPLFGMWIDRTQDFEEVVAKSRIESEAEAGL